MPLIFWGSALPDGAEAPASALSLDIAPTLASCAGLEVAAGWHGRDLLCSGSSPPPERALISQYGARRYSVRLDRWKLIVTRSEGDPFYELFDLASDPRERRNLAGENPEVVGRLKRQLRVWLSGLTPVERDAEPVELDPEERQRLEALGYL